MTGTRGTSSYAGGVSRWSGTWLSGAGAALEPREGDARWRGDRLGLPERGPGSVAGTGARLVAFLVDLVLASLVTSLFVDRDLDDLASQWTFNLVAVGVWLVITAVGVGLAGFTPGKLLLGLRVVRMDGGAMVGPLRSVPRTVLAGLVIPAAIWDRDGRGFHDRLTGTIELRIR
ncbi:RDD family protein [Actinokineospora fastidiosa]|uniref:RDD family protein n=1 Tax=Actinokineospora fastidiosa TaxID=1816 RepID=A0A918LGL3_9PSEU|nr:RDD family protein [Actinokineospora fastidiosa]